MNVIVNANAMRTSGTLTIYRQFISQLSKHIGKNRYFIFVDSSMPQPEIEGVEYIIRNDHSKFGYIRWCFWGLTRWLKKNKIDADLIISLQNIGTKTKTKQIIYYHQAIPLNERKWSFLKNSERNIAIYKYLYPLVVKYTLSQNTEIVVQIPSIKDAFSKKFNVAKENIHVCFPDIEELKIDSIRNDLFNRKYIHFIYPATGVPFKEHVTLVQALIELRNAKPSLVDKIKIHFTIETQDNVILSRYIWDNGLNDQFVFEGVMSHDDLLTYYNSSNGLLFPSTIETVGLPLIEAAAFGLPIIASDLEYAHEVLGDYDGVRYVRYNDYIGWASAIKDLCSKRERFTPLVKENSSWNDFFKLIKDEN